jgi:hypothetical protein
MSHRGVEIVLGRLATDAQLRKRFKQNPQQTLQELLAAGIELSAVERASLESLDCPAIDEFARTLDPRIKKAPLSETVGSQKGD